MGAPMDENRFLFISTLLLMLGVAIATWLAEPIDDKVADELRAAASLAKNKTLQ